MLSILIVNWNTRELLRACLQSILDHPPTCPYEVIVVDNASTDSSAEMVQKDFLSVRLHASRQNLGYAAGNNQAFALATGNLLLTLNPDTEFDDNSLDRAIEVLEANPSYGTLGARQISLDGSTQSSVRGFPTILGIAGELTGLSRAFPASVFADYRLPAFDYDLEQPAPQPMGTFLLFRREALQSVGDPAHPFDEYFPIFFNEVDLLFRLAKAGWPCLYSPRVRVIHHGGEGTKQVRKSMIWESHRSLVRFLRKHRWRWWNAPILLVVFGLVYVGAFVRAKGYDAGFRS
ncbi:MAG: glycosyltransferase family 2 protein [Fimbriimonadaceae bacterium]|nr:glycosyltransferase family 2 protein [Fimbriimonadaceae bacterium]